MAVARKKRFTYCLALSSMAACVVALIGYENLLNLVVEPNDFVESISYSQGTSSNGKFQRDYYDVCIVGAGLSGAVIAEQYASQLGMTSLIMEKRDHIGGNCYDYVDPQTGVLMNKYGAHLFHTKYPRVWMYVQQFSEWTPYEHQVLGKIKDKFVPIPVNIDTVNTLFGTNISSPEEMDQWLAKEQVHYDKPANSEEMALSRVGPRLYELIFKPYTVKQWAKTPAQLDAEVTARIPVRNDWDPRYFPGDVFQALPSKGYTKLFETLLSNPLIETHINVDYFKVRSQLKCGHTYFTGPIDAYFAHLGYRKLEYRSIDFEIKRMYNVAKHLPASVVNFPAAEYDFTRIVEYKHFPISPPTKNTVLVYERSKDDGEPYYPVPNKRNKELYSKYQQMTSTEPGVTFVGRLANYKYFNMDQTIKNALELFDSHAPRVVIRQVLHSHTGGPEALLQLALAFHAWMPHRTFSVNLNKKQYGHWIGLGYPRIHELQSFEEKDLRKGDIYIIPEVFDCPVDLVQKGVNVFIWQLASREEGKRIAGGCRILSHNFYLSHEYGVDVHRNMILTPYLNMKKTNFAPLTNDKREDLIIINHDAFRDSFRSEPVKEVTKLCESTNNTLCRVYMPQRLGPEQLMDLYQKAKIIMAPCIRGNERGPLEAVLSGVVVVTDWCMSSTDTRDFPLPREHIWDKKKNPLSKLVVRVLQNFEQEQAKLSGVRALHSSYSHETLVEETKVFMKSTNFVLFSSSANQTKQNLKN